MAVRVRQVAAIILIVLGVVLVPVGATASWLRTTVTNTDAYVATVAPLATDPDVIAAVENQMTNQVMDAVQQQQLLSKATDALVAQGVPPALAQALNLLGQPLGERLEALVRRVVTRVVESPAFVTAWSTANRLAHEQLISVLSQDPNGVFVSDGKTVSLKLSTLITTIEQALVNAGVPFADRLPEVTATIPIATNEGLQKAHNAYVALRAGGIVLPILALLLLIGGIALTRDRRRAVVVTGIAVVGACVLLLLGLAFARSTLTGSVQPTGQAAALAIFNTVSADLRQLVRAIVAVALLVVVVAFFAGPSTAARSSRALAMRSYFRIREVLGRSPVARPVAAAVAVICGLIVVFADGLGVAWTVALVVLALLAALVAWLSGRPPAAGPSSHLPADQSATTAPLPTQPAHPATPSTPPTTPT